MKAVFKCLKCGCRWKGEPGPTQCPMCKYLYVKWINYKKMREIWNRERERLNEEPI